MRDGTLVVAKLDAEVAMIAAQALEAAYRRRLSIGLQVDDRIVEAITALARAVPVADVGHSIATEREAGAAWLTTTEYARLTGMSERTVRRRADEGQLPSRRTSAGWQILFEGEK